MSSPPHDSAFVRPPTPTRHKTLSDGALVTLREATPEDAEAAIDYLAVIGGESDFLGFGEGEFGYDAVYERDFFAAQRDSLTNISFVARHEQEERIIAMLTFATGRRERMRHSGDFGVSTRKRFYGEGLATALLEMLIEWVEVHPVVRKVNLLVRADNARAVALYERLGFEREGTLRKVMRVGDEYFDDIAMGLWVEPRS